MAIQGQKISELTERAALTGAEQLPFEDGGANGKVTVATMKEYVKADIPASNASGTLILTQEQYDALEEKDENTVYFIKG